jgi:hypothetical protein
MYINGSPGLLGGAVGQPPISNDAKSVSDNIWRLKVFEEGYLFGEKKGGINYISSTSCVPTLAGCRKHS